MRLKRALLICAASFTLVACSEQQQTERLALDELKGPASILIDTWRSEGISDQEIERDLHRYMNEDGIEIFYDDTSKAYMKRV